MQKFLERHNLLKVTQEEIDNLNNLASIKGMEFILKKKKTFHKDTSGIYSLTGKFYQTFNKEIKPSPDKFFQKTEGAGIFPNLFLEVSITPTPTPDKGITIKRISFMNTDA